MFSFKTPRDYEHGCYMEAWHHFHNMPRGCYIDRELFSGSYMETI
jgi:hypothetical protein